MTDFLDPSELRQLRLGACGEEVRISRHALILSPEAVRIGSHSRIDAFSLLTGAVLIGSHVHLSAYVSILGNGETTIEDFCTVSARCSLFTSNDDYRGLGMTNPTVPAAYRIVAGGPVRLEAHSILGAGSVVLPNVTIGRSAAVGALTLVKEDIEDFAIVAGTPMRRIGTRSAEHLAKAEAFLRSSGKE